MKDKTKGSGFQKKQAERKIKYAGGIHLILEFWGAKNLDSIQKIKKALTEAVKAARATLLKIDLHKFSPQGVSGVAVIAESHISIHTWPEKKYAALDIFMCGRSDPYKSVDVLKKYFQPRRVKIIEIKRGEYETKK